jgi:hypothetical protein
MKELLNLKKPLDELTNTERASLMFKLFPKEIARCFNYQKQAYLRIWNDRDKVIEKWPEQHIMSPDTYVQLAKALHEMCDNAEALGGTPFIKTARKYGSLFDGHYAIISNHAVQHYSMTKDSTLRFQAAVSLLHGFDPLREKVKGYVKELRSGLIPLAAGLPPEANEWLEYSANELGAILCQYSAP